VSNAQFGNNRLFGLSSDDPVAVYSIDPATGAANEVLSLNGTSSIVGLSFVTGTPFGTDLQDFPGAGPNYSVGSFAPNGVITFLNDQEDSSNWWGLASDDCDRRVLYSVDNDSDPDYFLKEQLLDGTIRTIGATGVDAAGMAFDDENGILYALEDGGEDGGVLYTISIEDGTAQLIGPTGMPDDSIDLGLAYDELNRVLFGIAGNSGELYTLNVNTGMASLVGPIGVDVVIDGLAWLDDCPLVRPIPTLSEWGLIAMAGVLGIIGLLAIRRRKVTA